METLAARIARAGPLPDRDAVGWVIRLAKRVERMHARGTVHGRLSAACVISEDAPCTSKGWLSDPIATPSSVSYRSPERAAGEGPSRRDDTWALAVTLYVTLSGKLPFPARNDRELRRAIGAGAAPRITPPGAAGDALWLVLERALARDAAQRIVDVAELRRALEAARPGGGLGELPPLDEPALAEPPRTAPAPRPSSSGLRRASSSPPGGRSSSPPGGRSSSPPGGRSSSPPGERSSSLPPSSPTAARRTPVPLHGLATLGLRSMAGTPTTPVPETPDRPSNSQLASPSAPPDRTDAAAADTSSSPPAPDAPPARVEQHPVPASPGPRAAQDEPESPSPWPVRELPAPVGLHAPVDAPHAPSAPDAPSAPVDADAPHAPVGDALPLEPPEPSSLAPDSAVAHAVIDGRVGTSRALAAAPEPEPRRKARAAARWTVALAAAVVALAGAAAAWIWRLPLGAAPTQSAGAAAAPAACVAPAEPGVPATAGAGTPDTIAADASPEGVRAAAAEPADAGPADAGPADEGPADAGPASHAQEGDATTADFAACAAPLFPEGSVDPATAGQLSSVCAEIDPREGAAALQDHLAQAAGTRGASDATREWDRLGWYDLAMLAALRARCCPAPPPLELPPAPKRCAPLDTALNDLGAAVAASSGPDDRAVAKATRRYTQAVQCVVRARAASRYGREGTPKRSEARAFKKALARALRDAAPRR
ncbi:hypothetical protein WMF31_01205 [Sorangium sp. So ce1036]|uniref:hypothetical protein n=1 Tax=Sorangium sp. So ce1036 TaxID=3133328 RepID=UPI003F0F6F1B